MRVPWVSLSLLIVLGLLAAVASSLWDEGEAPEMLAGILLLVGWIGVAGSLLVGALGLWARAPATLATALGILGAGAFAGAWIANSGPQEAPLMPMVIVFTGIVIAFAASARRPA